MFYRKLEFLGEECHPEGVVLAQFKAGVHQRMLSPRTRKVALAAFETGLADRIRLIPSPIGINNDHPQENPLRQEPTLVTADGIRDSLRATFVSNHRESSGESRIEGHLGNVGYRCRCWQMVYGFAKYGHPNSPITRKEVDQC